ncbi:hypothetical protein [Segatella copri]|uniref:Uncharacterized protein n=1 Tax=Segatella copri TaxID=165179 RepID=A0AAW5IDX5_9BACT|nr:hypothetical protein [Segatella copri]MCP9546495.1 hypothetical protein [Segatella copri]MCP9549913.1 hypothetical protein [Segatella copri]MCP9556200.1 hypothetical protein [Segatella copri]MCP9570813.1 hypothetical protein [Segatella copri]
MTDQQLYIDGILMDMSEDSAITLDIKSNLFRDITKMTANTTYTINLPKTAHNMAVLEFAGKPSTSSKYPYIFHTARYFRNGLEIIHSGRASVLSVKETIEISIYWGLFQALATLQSSDLKLNELNCTKYLLFTKDNSYDTYEKAIEDGVFYGRYETAVAKTSSDEWYGYDRSVGGNSDTTYSLVEGKIRTGTEVGKYVSGEVLTDETYQCAIIPFEAGMRATIRKVLGKGQFRTWAILDTNKNVISLADDSGKTEKETYPVLPAPDPILGMFVYAGACIANIETSVDMDTISIKVRAEKAGSIEYGVLNKETGETTPWGTYEINAAGETEFNVVKSKPSGLLVYIKPSVDNMVNMVLSTAVAAYYLSGGKLSKLRLAGAYSVKYTSESMPIDVDLQAPATAEWLIINAIKAYSTGTTILVKSKSETENNARASSGTFERNGSFGGGGSFGSSWGNGTIQPSVTAKYILDLVTAQTGVAFGWSNQAKEIIKGLAVPLITRKADVQTVVGRLEGTFFHAESLGILDFQPTSLSEVFDGLEIGHRYSQLNVKISCKMIFDVQMNWSWDASKVTPSGHKSWSFGEGSTEWQAFYSYPPNYIEMKVKHKNDDGTWTETLYIAGLQQDETSRKYVTDYESDKVNGRFIHLVAGRGEIDLEEGDIVTFEMKHPKNQALIGLKCYNGRLSASIKQSDEVPYGGNFPIGKNLPDIKVTDFLKCICILTSTFPSQRFIGGTLTFADIVNLWEDKAHAVDWTKKLIPSEASNHPRQTDFSVEDYCQHNIYKWKEDDTVYQQHDADMTIDNKTLEYTQDVCTLPFAATDGNRIPIYEWESKQSTFNNTTYTRQVATKYKACKDRIVNLTKNDAGYAELAFNIDLQDIFDNKLEKLRKTVANPHHIVERFNLSDLEILNFDETKPVYLAQYGAYFAVLEIKTTNSGYCEVTMIELNN